MNPLRPLVTAALVAVILSSLAVPNAHAAPITIDWVTVGDPGNANDPATGNSYGGVGYEYRIGKYEVTIGQYADFLNAAAQSDPYGLWDSNMETNLNLAGIARNGTSGAYQYAVVTVSGSAPYGGVSNANRPISYISWFDAARFANWMQNGQGSGSTETGAYTLNGATSGTAPAKNPNAQFYIPTENEWYKAAYYSQLLNSGSGGYYTYATQSNTAPGNMIGGGANQANYKAPDGQGGTAWAVTQFSGYASAQNYLTDVGAFTNSASYYGTFDQTGNVLEYTGSVGTSFDGYYSSTISNLGRQNIVGISLSNGTFGTGFRLAAPVAVPEPTTYAMALAGAACGGFSMWRRRKRA